MKCPYEKRFGVDNEQHPECYEKCDNSIYTACYAELKKLPDKENTKMSEHVSIQKVKKDKHTLETQLLSLLSAFESEHQVRVEGIHTERIQALGELSKIVSVKLTVEI